MDINNEKNVSAEKETEKHGAWLQKTHEHKEWKIGAEEKKTKGQKKTDCIKALLALKRNRVCLVTSCAETEFVAPLSYIEVLCR